MSPHVAQVELTDEAKFMLTCIPVNDDYVRVRESIRLLADFPELGHEYEPTYDKASPSELRVLFAGYYGIYYLLQEEKTVVLVVTVEDQRRAPQVRFMT
ncbi:MAG: type II toxin-antitoxin system RelE/ParE family toxin [Olsenella sp.]|nr:type II toxin-antitoxin system RelE/ParE family toxin [Olsenella sp.]